MTPLAIVSVIMAISAKVVLMLLDGAKPEDIGATVAAESAAFYAAQRLADEKTKAKFPDYQP